MRAAPPRVTSPPDPRNVSWQFGVTPPISLSVLRLLPRALEVYEQGYAAVATDDDQRIVVALAANQHALECRGGHPERRGTRARQSVVDLKHWTQQERRPRSTDCCSSSCARFNPQAERHAPGSESPCRRRRRPPPPPPASAGLITADCAQHTWRHLQSDVAQLPRSYSGDIGSKRGVS